MGWFLGNWRSWIIEIKINEYIKIYTGIYKNKVAIAGISTTFKNIYTDKTLKPVEHKS